MVHRINDSYKEYYLMKTERIAQIKKDHFIKTHRNNQQKSWKDKILDADGEGCVNCFFK
jgi:hypothetical protein